MIIEVKDLKVVPNWILGSERKAVVLKKEGILGKLNSVINWNSSRFPKTLGDEKTEDRSFLGDEPLLMPGNAFVWDGSVYAIDSMDIIYLLHTNSGQGAIKRLEEEIMFEYEISSYVYPEDLDVSLKFDENLGIEGAKLIPLTEANREAIKFAVNIDFVRDSSKGKYKLISLKSEDYDFPVEFIISSNGTLYYKPEEMDEVCMKGFVKVLSSWSFEHQ